ncbi:hypothetical protein R5R73_02710 [Salinicola sp. LHM]|uniref:hypothetical protein n=1 Tax=Salinicola sp. LHM TaxID=3065298 RepID=UPI002ACE8E2B|nr:hypothetical protein [Salinicola sp. LHM]WQH33607.1 hypothetical protein R5R73_02710 [Salinicola sp. LHM]
MASVRLFPARFIRSRARAHRAMARAALFSDSSTAVRLHRYNAHMAKARMLDALLAESRQPADAAPAHTRTLFTVREAAQ